MSDMGVRFNSVIAPTFRVSPDAAERWRRVRSAQGISGTKAFEGLVYQIGRSILNQLYHPRWTTPAEFTLVNGVVDSMVQQAKTMLGLKQALFTGAEAIELNPQPEPPSPRALAQELMSHTLP
jgi:hypothetical protein